MKFRLNFRSLLSVCCLAAVAVASQASAAPLDFRTFVQEDYPLTSFARTGWIVATDGVSTGPVFNGSPSVLYSPDSLIRKKVTGRVYPANRMLTGESAGNGDDDIWGFVLGFNPGNATQPNTTADYLMLDWKRFSQSFNFVDRAADVGTFHDLTPGGSAFIGMSMSRVQGVPNADELWQKIDYVETAGGSVTFLAAANTLGATGYGIGDQFHDFEFHYEANRVQVWVDGVQQFDIAGTFGNGRFGIYHHSQDAVTTFTDFAIESLSPVMQPGDFDGDGDVDGADFVAWQTNFPSPSGATLAQGDADGDGDVDGADFVVWQTNFPFTPGAGGSPVPEPGAFVLASLGGVLALAVGRRRQRS